jgi:hypothetical protein
VRPAAVRNSVRALLLLLRGAARFHVGPEALEADALALRAWRRLAPAPLHSPVDRRDCPRRALALASAGLPASHASALRAAWSTSFGAARATAVHAATSGGVSLSRLVDLQWRWVLAASSDELSRLGESRVQLRFVVDRDGARVAETAELSPPQFFDFLAQLERAKAHVDAAATAMAAGAPPTV